MQKIALVCCRAGSKGIKNKNIKLFNGKPLLYWTAKSIIDTKLFNKVYLNSICFVYFSTKFDSYQENINLKLTLNLITVSNIKTMINSILIFTKIGWDVLIVKRQKISLII